MSFKLLPLALDHGPADPMARLVFFTLCERADGDTGICWPSYCDIMERTGLSRSTVIRRLRALERDGWIARKRRFNSSSQMRVNIQRMRIAEAERSRRVSEVPDDWAAFPEEAAQVVENKGKGLADPRKGLADPGKGLADPGIGSDGTPNLSLNLSHNLAVRAVDLNATQRSQAKAGTSFFWKGRVVRGAELRRLSETLA